MEREDLIEELKRELAPTWIAMTSTEILERNRRILAEYDAFILDVEHWRRKWSEAEARAAGLKEERDEQEKRGKNLDEMIFKIGKALGLDAIPGYILTATNDFVREIKSMKDGRDIAREALAKSRALVQQLNDRLQEANQTIRDRPDIHYQILDSLFVHGEAFVYDGEVLDPAKVVIHRKKKEPSEDLKVAVERRVKSLMLLIRAGSFPLIAIEIRKLVESGLKFAGEGPLVSKSAEIMGPVESTEGTVPDMSWCQRCESYHPKGNCLTETVQRLSPPEEEPETFNEPCGLIQGTAEPPEIEPMTVGPADGPQRIEFEDEPEIVAVPIEYTPGTAEPRLCLFCDGTGSNSTGTCAGCHGTGYVPEPERVEIPVKFPSGTARLSEGEEVTCIVCKKKFWTELVITMDAVRGPVCDSCQEKEFGMNPDDTEES